MNSILRINIKVFFIVIIFLILFCTFCTTFTYAEEMNLKEEFNTNDWNPSGSTVKEEQKLKNIGNKIIGTIQVIGSVVSVVAIMIIGIRYMAGSIEEKAQYKETLGPYFIGAVLVFGIITVLILSFSANA